MKVILTQPVEKLGTTGDVVSVAPGYGRNFLIPKKLAILADASNRKSLEHQKRILEHRRKKDVASAEDLLSKLEGLNLKIARKAGEFDKLFGSVTNQDVAALLAEAGIKIDRKQIQLIEPIKTLGNHVVPVKMQHIRDAKVKVAVVAE